MNLSRILFSSFFLGLTAGSGYCQQWIKLGDDAAGDVNFADQSDIKSFHYYYDQSVDTIVFMISLHNAVRTDSIGLNVALNVAGAGDSTAWFGPQNTNFKMNRLLTFWYIDHPSGTFGLIGIADAQGVLNDNLENLARMNLRAQYNSSLKYYVLSARRADIFDTSDFRAAVIASAGLPGVPNDDIPNQGSFYISGSPNSTRDHSITILKAASFPNPSAGIFKLSLPEMPLSGFTLCVFDINGRLVSTQGFGPAVSGQADFDVDLSALENGVYTLLIETPQAKFTSRILIR